MRRLDKVLRWLMYFLPAVLFFSYYPVIALGSNSSMNFELSLPLIWLVVFDVVGIVDLVHERKLFKWLERWRWLWLLFPAWLTVSVFWSSNIIRGLLTVGILWLIYVAGYIIWSLRGVWNEKNREVWWRWFWWTAIVACVWCVIQCVLDMTGVSRDYSLMCAGCTYRMFGFPHPNGFAIEPQFMGNLLLAPAIMAAGFLIKDYVNDEKCSKWLMLCFPVVVMALFLTFSRGAIYALMVGMLFMTGFAIYSVKQKERFRVAKRMGIVWGGIILSFVLILGAQGVMAEVGPTNDTFYDGISKALNHLSLGIIDIRREQPLSESNVGGSNEAGTIVDDKFVPVENLVENHEDTSGDEAIFDGYVAESTDVRVKMNELALGAWSDSASSVMFGVGIGGAGETMYQKGLTATPKEIVQNEYVSLLLETGMVGISLFVLTLVLIVGAVWKCRNRIAVISLLVAYGVSMMFFAGLPNVLHIFLLPTVFVMMGDYKEKRK